MFGSAISTRVVDICERNGEAPGKQYRGGPYEAGPTRCKVDSRRVRLIFQQLIIPLHLRLVIIRTLDTIEYLTAGAEEHRLGLPTDSDGRCCPMIRGMTD
jgi:hypothetical protein